MTDVNIAVHLLEDAYDGVFDTALLISADGDLAAPVEAVRRRFPTKRIIVVAPPDRHYGKKVFAHRVVRPKAETIDFTGFRPFLTNIVAVISHHKATVISPPS